MGRLAYKERLRVAAQNTVRPAAIPAPIKGWNTRDALDAMDPLDAVVLDNFYPDVGGVTVRNGYVPYATTEIYPAFSSGFSSGFLIGQRFTGPVQTLAEYNFGATRKFFAAASGSFFDISAGSASGAAVASGFTSDQWQWTPFLSRLFFVNGADTMQIYNGTAFASATFTGVTLATLVGVTLYQQRLFFWQNNSSGFWYAPLNSVSGALSFYDLSSFASRGGTMVAAVTFSHDGGDGVTDIIAFMLSSGDCLLFYGNDPGNASAWQLVGKYRISPPVGPRAVCSYGAESFITTYDDHVPLQEQLVALKLGQLPARSKVSTAVQAAVAANLSATGWQALFYPKGRRLIFNIPNTDGTFDQHVRNTGVPDQPWCRFTNMNAFCWGLYRNDLYFGTAGGNIYKADIGNLDLASPVDAFGQQAWNTLKSPMRKRATAARPLVQSAGTPAFTLSMGFDYGDINISTIEMAANTGSPWDTSPWDTTPWSPEQRITTDWHGVGGTGVALSVALAIASNQASTWLRTDLRYEAGSGM